MDNGNGEGHYGDDSGERRFLFDLTPVLLTPPPGLAEGLADGDTIAALLEGEWITRKTKGDRFAVVDFTAFLTIPRARVRLARGQRVKTLTEAVIPLVLTELDAAKGLEKAFGPVNAGSYDATHRLVVSCVALQALFGTALGSPLGPAPLLLRATGLVDRQGHLRMAGSGMVLSGPLKGTILACAGMRLRQGAPDPPRLRQEGGECEVTITPKVSGATHDGEAYTDFSSFDTDGDGDADVEFEPGGPTGAAELGPVNGRYVFPDGRLGIGYFVKTEVDITVEAPCKIVFVERRMRTLAGHNLYRVHDWEPDNIVEPGEADAESKLRDHPSVKLVSDQRWIVTDAPGNVGGPKLNKHYKKEFEFIVSIEAADGSRFKRREAFVAELRTDGSGNIVTD